MEKNNFCSSNYSCFLLLIFLLSAPLFSNGDNSTISRNKYITRDTTIISNNRKFELGFFKPGKSPNYYVGIWYKNISPQTVVWVANRVNPIPSRSINSTRLQLQGRNLVVIDPEHNNLFWSTSYYNKFISNYATVKQNSSSVSVALGDDGNLVLMSGDGGAPLWQSFDHPTDSFLPGSKYGYNKRTGARTVFTSWNSPHDPSPGLFSLFYVPNHSRTVWNRTEIYDIGPYKLGSTTMRLNPNSNFTFVDNDNETYIMYHVLISAAIVFHKIDINGQEKSLMRSDTSTEWMMSFVSPLQQCDVYAFCGEFAICTEDSTPVCDCLRGFRNRSKTELEFNELSGGCVRKKNLECLTDRFSEYSNMRLPRHPRTTSARNRAECESKCLNNCSCTAYAYNSNGSCSSWVGPLLNLKQFAKGDGNGSTIYIRLAASEFPNNPEVTGGNSKHMSRELKVIIPSVAIVAAALLTCSICCVCYKRKKQTQKIKGHVMDQMIDEDNDEKGINVQFFTFQSILEATNNFSHANELGKGGFGPVYKGMFPGGQEIAVKKLSNQSKQGNNEFKNEVVLIAKLQHRNLVKLLGYCMQGGEKMLVYEYLPNKSLDNFIFDQTRRLLVGWSMRFDIILGIARGLLYLHHDSRLRIIHRDMKTNNILLDEEMIPKISDFGLARMMTGNTLQANTKKVVGTYGYMSPEYALRGVFSIKSDIFSFGVIILEIISGKKNTAFYQHEEVSNLIGYAWKLWNEGVPMELVDDSILEHCNEYEVLKCINIGLLCVEEDPNCRPNMSNVLLMLSDESRVLPKPNQPAFVPRTKASNDSTKVQSDEACTNQLTISTQEGR